jgi:ubiquinone/menaquinone biosynthesis C-methylase UbiE
MKLVEHIHSVYVHNRRLRRLCDYLVEFIPPKAHVLDVGCGDGLLAHLLMQKRPDIDLQGLDVLVREHTYIPVEQFDGRVIPYDDASFDVVLFVDVLHHTEDPMILLREAMRVARDAIMIKDHTADGLFARLTLRFMDQVGNARHGVALPYNYWSQQRWLEAFDALNLAIGVWKKDLRLYPRPAHGIFGRSLHFIARLELPVEPSRGSAPKEAKEASESDVAHILPLNACCADSWEAAYLRFETPEREIRKFVERLTKMGAARWPRNAEIVELFCGRGNGLHALSKLGFTQIEGVDLSASLLAQYTGPAKLHTGDCRRLPFDDCSKDIVIVQGGLHHLLTLPDDLEQTLSEVHRVLREHGLFVVVEPWLTPFLSFVHMVCRNRGARHVSSKIEALATMIRHEQRTYKQWLGQPQAIISLFEQYFHTDWRSIAWGKLMFVGYREKTLSRNDRLVDRERRCAA